MNYLTKLNGLCNFFCFASVVPNGYYIIPFFSQLNKLLGANFLPISKIQVAKKAIEMAK